MERGKNLKKKPSSSSQSLILFFPFCHFNERKRDKNPQREKKKSTVL